jgi:DNA-binding IclR family transcriptional regulator
MKSTDTKGAESNAGNKAGIREIEAGSIRSVQRAFAVLRCLSADRPKATLTQFTQLTGLATSTVQRLLSTMEADDVLRRLPNGQYTFGGALLQFGVAALEGGELYVIVEPHLEALSAASRESANFGVLNRDGEVLYLRQSLSPRAIRHVSWLGRRFSADGTAVGGALQGHTDARGLVATRKTLEPDVTAIAAPIYGAGGAIVGAISITGPTYRIDDAALAHFGTLLIREAAAVSVQIGGGWPYEPADRGDAA